MLALRRTRLLRPPPLASRCQHVAPSHLRLTPRVHLVAFLSTSSPPKPQIKPDLPKPTSNDGKIELHENIYTIPNALTVSRIIACPFLGYFIVKGDFVNATWLLAYAGISDWVGQHGSQASGCSEPAFSRSMGTWLESGIWAVSLAAYWTQRQTKHS